MAGCLSRNDRGLAWLVSAVFLPFGVSRAVRGLLGVFAGIAAGIGKELYDKKTTGVVEKKDLIADGIGLVLFYLIHMI